MLRITCATAIIKFACFACRVYFLHADTPEDTRAWKETLLEFAPVLEESSSANAAHATASQFEADAADASDVEGASAELDEATQLAMAMSIAAQEDNVGTLPTKPEHMSEEDYAVLTSALLTDVATSKGAAAAAPTVADLGEKGQNMEQPSEASTARASVALPPPPAPCRPPRHEETAEGVLPEQLLDAESAEAEATHSGWLQKRSAQGVFQNWRKRWVVLRGWTLLYYAKRGASAPKGAIALSGAGVRLLKPKQGGAGGVASSSTGAVAVDGDADAVAEHTFADKPCILAITTASGRRFMFHGDTDFVVEEWTAKIKEAAPVMVGEPLHIHNQELWHETEQTLLADTWDLTGVDSDSDDDLQYNDEHRAYLEYAAARETALERELQLVDAYNGTNMAEQLKAQLQSQGGTGGRRGSIAFQAASNGTLSSGGTSIQDFVSVLGALAAESPDQESPAARAQASALAAAAITSMLHSDRARVLAAIQASQGLGGQPSAQAAPLAANGAAVAPPLPPSEGGALAAEAAPLQHLHLAAALAAASAENQALRHSAEQQADDGLLAATQRQQAEVAAEVAAAESETLRAQNLGLSSQIAQMAVSLSSSQAHIDGLQGALASMLRPAADAAQGGGQEPAVGPPSAAALRASLVAITGERDAFAAECMALRGQFAVQLSSWQEHIAQLQGKLRAQAAEVAAARATASAWGEGQVWAHVRSARHAGVREGVRRVLSGFGEAAPPATLLADDETSAAVSAVSSHKATWPEALSSGLEALGIELDSSDEKVRETLASLEAQLATRIGEDIAALTQEHRVLRGAAVVGAAQSVAAVDPSSDAADEDEQSAESTPPASASGGEGGEVPPSPPDSVDLKETTAEEAIAVALQSSPVPGASIDAMKFTPSPTGHGKAAQPPLWPDGGAPAPVHSGAQGKVRGNSLSGLSQEEQLARMREAIARLEAAAAVTGGPSEGGSEIDSTALRRVREQVAQMEASAQSARAGK